MRPLGAELGVRETFLLVAFTALVQANSLGSFFVGDDFDTLVLARDAGGLRALLGQSFWGEWEPAWWATWYLDHALWGLAPAGYHLTNLAWLCFAVVGLFVLLRKLLPERPLATWTATLLFAAHPVHDEAVAYLAARGHVIAAGLALWAIVVARSPGRGRGAASPLLALLAMLAKEWALVLPAWALIIDWARPRASPSGLRETWIIAARFAAAGALSLGLRGLVVGFGSDKLAGPLGGGAGLDRLIGEVPLYWLLGTLPLPFALLDAPVVEGVGWLGWLSLLATAAGLTGLGLVAWTRRRPLSPETCVFVAGVVLAAVSVAPVFWADLPFRRRYLFAPTIGAAFMSAAAVGWNARRRNGITAVLSALLVLAFAAASVWRNELYRRSGAVARSFLVTARGAPLEQPVDPSAMPEVALITLPRAWGGDWLSGAYLFHESDVVSALALFARPQHGLDYALKCYHADDYATELLAGEDGAHELLVRFRSHRAFADARVRDPAQDRAGESALAELVGEDPVTRTLRFRIRYRPRADNALYRYGSGEFVRVSGWDPTPHPTTNR